MQRLTCYLGQHVSGSFYLGLQDLLAPPWEPPSLSSPSPTTPRSLSVFTPSRQLELEEEVSFLSTT